MRTSSIVIYCTVLTACTVGVQIIGDGWGLADRLLLLVGAAVVAGLVLRLLLERDTRSS
jgi:hypothetical protein